MVALDKSVATARQKVAEFVEGALAALKELGHAYAISLSAAIAREETYKEEFEQAVAAQQTHAQLFAESSEVGQLLREAEEDEINKARVVGLHAKATSDFETSLSQLADFIRSKRNVLSGAAAKVEELSGGMLKARSKSDPNPREYVDAICKILAATKVHDLQSKAELWISALQKRDASQSWTQIASEILEIYRAKVGAGFPSEASTELGPAAEVDHLWWKLVD